MTQIKVTIGSEGVISPHQNGEEAPFFVSDSPNETPKVLTLDEDQLRSHLKAITKQIGFIADAAAVWGVSPQFLGDVLAGRKSPGRKLLGRLGVRVRKVYEIQEVA